jgi:replicative DNA helicase
MDSQIHSIELERHVLSGLVHNGLDVYVEINNFLSEKDFYESTHRVIYSIINQLLVGGEKIDKVILAQKIKDLGIHVFGEMDIFAYIDVVCFTSVTKAATIKAAQDLIRLRMRRDVESMGESLKKLARASADKTGLDFINNTDTIYHKTISSFHTRSLGASNIFEDLEAVIEERGNNPQEYDQTFLVGPFQTVNRIYGSLLRPGAINLVAARTGVGKTAIGMYYLTWVAERYNLPILHLDFGEMSKEELQMRAVCMLTGGRVPLHLIEQGTWRKSAECERLVRSVWPRVRTMKLFYEDISLKSPAEIVSIIKRFYFLVVGRDIKFDPKHRKTKLLIHYDYLKPFDFNPNVPEYKEMGHFIQSLKSLILNEIDAAAWVSLQSNRKGITNNRLSSQIDDSEDIFSLSDRIIQQVNHAWIIRQKLMDEVAYEGDKYGNLKMKNVKHRSLGMDYQAALNPVKVGKKYERNYINLASSSFFFEDKGDLNKMAQELKEIYENTDEQGGKEPHKDEKL